jgi:hypothetical protein
VTRARAALLCALLAASACSKDSNGNKPQVVRMMGNQRSVPPPSPDSTDTPEGPTDPPPAPTHVEITSQHQAPAMHLTQVIRLEAGVEKVDPDVAVLDAARASGAGCFTGITDGSAFRSAVIKVTVLPTGSVSKSEVSSPNTTEADILSCLESVGEGLRFSEKPDRPAVDLRTYAISVSVTRTH